MPESSGAIHDASDDTQAAVPDLLLALEAWDQVERHRGRR